MVDLLLRSGYLEDAAAPPPGDLSAAETERYSRNKAFFRWVDLVPRAHGWEAQVALKRARVLVLGLGGTGSHAAWALAAAGVGRIHCVDRDVVEVSNLTRQALFTEADIGRPKADVVVERLTAINSGVRVTGETRAVESRADVSALLAGFDALALCADEPRGQDSIRIWANRACLMAGVPWAVGGYRGPLVSVGVLPPHGPCYECLTAAIEASLEPGVHVDLGGPGVLAPSMRHFRTPHRAGRDLDGDRNSGDAAQSCHRDKSDRPRTACVHALCGVAGMRRLRGAGKKGTEISG